MPAIASCFGASARQGESLSVDMTGSETNFAPGKSRAVFSGTGITVTSTTVTDATHDFSARVESTNGAGIIAERPMYFNYNGVWTGGHDVVGFMP